MRVPDTIKDIYREVFPLVRPGGSFLNLDRVVPSIGKQIRWLISAGLEDADCYWKGTRRALSEDLGLRGLARYRQVIRVSAVVVTSHQLRSRGPAATGDQ